MPSGGRTAKLSDQSHATQGLHAFAGGRRTAAAAAFCGSVGKIGCGGGGGGFAGGSAATVGGPGLRFCAARCEPAGRAQSRASEQWRARWRYGRGRDDGRRRGRGGGGSDAVGRGGLSGQTLRGRRGGGAAGTGAAVPATGTGRGLPGRAGGGARRFAGIRIFPTGCADTAGKDCGGRSPGRRGRRGPRRRC